MRYVTVTNKTSEQLDIQRGPALLIWMAADLHFNLVHRPQSSMARLMNGWQLSTRAAQVPATRRRATVIGRLQTPRPDLKHAERSVSWT